jgi:hypothetical protein
LPEKLEGEASASRPTVYIGSVNINVFVDSPEEEDVADGDVSEVGHV